MKKRNVFLCIILLLSLLNGCQSSPSKVVQNKNEAEFLEKASQKADTDNTADATQHIDFSDVFFSTDNTVEYHMQLDKLITDTNMPVITVSPHYITENEAEVAAKALFGDVSYYEWQHWDDAKPSRSQIQDKINRWSEYTNQEALTKLFGDVYENSDHVIKTFIQEYTSKLESADKNDNRKECAWHFKKAPFYLFSSNEAENYKQTREDNLIKATLDDEGIPFTFLVGSRNEVDYKANYIRAYIESDSPFDLDVRFFTAKLCRTDKPTDAQVDCAVKKAETILENMHLGKWTIENYKINTNYYGDIPEYTIYIEAIPVLNGVASICQEKIANLTANDIYASTYQMTSCEFVFSANSDLISFSLDSPIDITNVINDNVAVIPMDEIVNLAKNNLIYRSFYSYDTTMMLDASNQNIKCEVKIDRVKYALGRIRVANEDDIYYYVPAVVLLGDAEFYDKSTDEYLFTTPDLTLISINAVDGTIINTTNS